MISVIFMLTALKWCVNTLTAALRIPRPAYVPLAGWYIQICDRQHYLSIISLLQLAAIYHE